MYSNQCNGKISTDARASINGYDLQLLRIVERLFEAVRKNRSIFCTIEYLDDVFQMESKDNSEYSIVTEQDKYYSKSFSINSEQVLNSLQIFLDNWIDFNKSGKIEFLFYTNTGIAKEKMIIGFEELPAKPVLCLFSEGSSESAYKYILPVFRNRYCERHGNDKTFIKRFDNLKEEDWARFFTQIRWEFNSPSNDELRNNINKEIGEFCNEYKLDIRFNNYIFGMVYTEIIRRLNEKDFLNKIIHSDTIKNIFLELLNMVKKDSPVEWEYSWFHNKLNESIANLGERFSSALDIAIDQEEILNFVCAGHNKKQYIISKLDEIRIILSSEIEEIHRNILNDKFSECIKLVSQEKEASGNNLINSIKKTIDVLIGCINEALPKDSKPKPAIFIEKLNKMQSDFSGYYNKTWSKASNSIEKCFIELVKIREYIAAAFYPYVLITGKAGIGKSHFIAHCAQKYLSAKGACILVLGNLFNENRPLMSQIQERLEVSSKNGMDDFLSYLNKYGENCGNRSIIFFDALNEGSAGWKNEILGFLKRIELYPWIGIVMSLRSKSNEILNSQLANLNNIISIELNGFANIKDASQRFFEFYKIPMNMSDRFRYEFQSPLFLKMYCKSYKEQIECEANGLKSILNCFFKSVNLNICKRLECNEKINFTKIATDAYVDLILKTGKRENDYDTVNSVINEKLTKQCGRVGFLEELLSENILAYAKSTNDCEDTYTVYFEYELFGDYLIAERIIERMKLADFACESQFEDFFSHKNPYDDFVRDQGIKEMLAVLIPDIKCRYKNGGFEVHYWPREYMNNFEDYIFYNSLLWRSGKKIHHISYSYLMNKAFIFYKHDMMHDLFETILKLCIVKNHHYNITFLQDRFMEFNDKALNRNWTVFVSENFFKSDIFKDIITLAKNQFGYLDLEEKQLLGITLSWCLVSLDDNVREECISGLYEMYKEDLTGLLFVIKSFEKYTLNKAGIVIEALYLVAMHATYYASDKDGITKLCSYIDSSYDISEMMIKGYFMILEYKRNILDFGYKFGYFNNILGRERRNRILNEYRRFEHVDDKEILTLIKKKNMENDYILYYAVESAEDEEAFEEYYTCQNNILFSLMSLYTEVGCKFEKIDFKTECFLDVILPEYRADFCKNVIKEIFKLGYNYIDFGFYDLWHTNNYKAKCLAQNYERIAFNIVLNMYLSYVNRICFRKISDVIKYSGMWGFTYYESFDVSISDENLYEQYKHYKLYNYEELEKNISENDYIRINGTSDGSISTYIADKEECIDPDKIQNQNGDCFEGIYYSELFLSEGFFKYFELLDKDERIMSATKNYMWDCKPFANFSILNPFIYKRAQLSISKDKMKYYRRGEEVCFNTIKHSGFDEFMIKVDFLKEFLISCNYKIIWNFRDLQNNKNLIIQYDGININKIYVKVKLR